jgi:molecular chaperone DnaK (HSP70)
MRFLTRYYRSARAAASWWKADTSDVVHDFVTFDREYGNRDVGIELRMQRMEELFSRLVDKMGVDITSLVQQYELEKEYQIDNSPSDD